MASGRLPVSWTGAARDSGRRGDSRRPSIDSDCRPARNRTETAPPRRWPVSRKGTNPAVHQDPQEDRCLAWGRLGLRCVDHGSPDVPLAWGRSPAKARLTRNKVVGNHRGRVLRWIAAIPESAAGGAAGRQPQDVAQHREPDGQVRNRKVSMTSPFHSQSLTSFRCSCVCRSTNSRANSAVKPRR